MGRLTMLLLACMRGNIFVYQGEELGLPQARLAYEQLRDPEAIANWPLTLGRDGARTPMPWTSKAAAASSAGAPAEQARPWLPLAPEHLALAVDLQERDANSQLAYTRRVLKMRNEHAALRTGSIQVLEASDAVLAFERRSRDERLLCVFNLSTEPRSWQPRSAERWRIIERTGTVERWNLPPLSGLVAQRDA
jgi:alpha-glucosidase